MEKIKASEISKPEYIGNKILYDMCEQYKSNDVAENVSAKFWLIGRSYAASPERRDTKPTTTEKKYEYFFDRFSEIFVKNSSVKEIDDLIDNLNKSDYTGNYDCDKELISNAIHLVELFNRTVIKTIKELDKSNKDENQMRQNISFSSKYLHFHCKKIIYIIDSYSNANAKNYCKYFKNEIQLDEKKKDFKSNFQFSDNNIDNPYKTKIYNYIDHFLNCYFIATYQSDTMITPREVDTFLLQENWK